MTLRRIIITMTVMLASLLTFISVGSAANLGINETHTITSSSAKACMSGVIDITMSPSKDTITGDGFTDECFGKVASITLLYPNYHVTHEATVSERGTWTSNISPMGATSINGAFAHIDGWDIPARWTTPQSDYKITYIWSQSVPQQFCVSVQISTQSQDPVPWEAEFDTSQYPLNGDTNISNYQPSWGYVVNASTDTKIRVTGLDSNTLVSKSRALTFELCNYETPPPPLPGIDSGIQNQVSIGALPEPGYYVCQNIEITTTESEFYVGWEVTYDSKPLAGRFIPGGGTIIPPSHEFTVEPLEDGIYRITSKEWSTSGVREGSPVNFEICWGALSG